MDLSYWNFRHWPFDRTTSPKSVYSSSTYSEAFSRLLFLIEERRRCGLLTGLSGTGKSCLFRHVQTVARRLGRCCIFIDASGLEGVEFAWRAAEGCQADCLVDDSPSKIWSSLQRRFEGLAIVRQSIVILIDHFDLVEFDCNQAVKRILQLGELTGADVTVLIVSRERFTAPLVLDLVELHVELSAWTEIETAEFIHDALIHAGCDQSIFRPDAVRQIHSVTHGNPARVIALCDLSLLASMSDGHRTIDSNVVESASLEFSPSINTRSLPHKRSTAMALV